MRQRDSLRPHDLSLPVHLLSELDHLVAQLANPARHRLHDAEGERGILLEAAKKTLPVHRQHRCRTQGTYGGHPDLLLEDRHLTEEIARFPEVQEVHIITGDWDLLVKLRAENVDAVGKFVVDNLRRIKGLEKTLTCMVFATVSLV